MKVVINACFGGFSVSKAAAEHMAANGCPVATAELAEYDAKMTDPSKQDEFEQRWGFRWYGYGHTDGGGGYVRNSPQLVAAVEALGDAASGDCARLRVVEMPDGVEWTIEEYDGNEHVAEVHRTWS